MNTHHDVSTITSRTPFDATERSAICRRLRDGARAGRLVPSSDPAGRAIAVIRARVADDRRTISLTRWRLAALLAVATVVGASMLAGRTGEPGRPIAPRTMHSLNEVLTIDQSPPIRLTGTSPFAEARGLIHDAQRAALFLRAGLPPRPRLEPGDTPSSG